MAPPLPPRSQQRSPKKVHHPSWLRRALSHRGQRHVARQVPGRTATHHPRSPLRRRCNQDEYLTERSTLDNPLPLRGPSQVEGAKRFAAAEPALRATTSPARHPSSRAGWATGRRSSGATGASSRVLSAHADAQDCSQPRARHHQPEPPVLIVGRLRHPGATARQATGVHRETPLIAWDEPRARPAPQLIMRRPASPGTSHVHGQHRSSS